MGTILDDEISGGKGMDTLSGHLGDDALNGGPGGDFMSGGSGNDTYNVNHPDDVVSDTSGIDLVISELSYKMPLNIEKLGLVGDKNLTGTGNELDNRISDGGGNDVLRGMGGDDTLRAGQGVNTLLGGAGKDTFAFSLFPQKKNLTKIMDFEFKSETIVLDHGSFSGLKIGTLKKGQFASGSGLTEPTDGSDRIIYDTKSGNLYFFDKNQDSDPVRKFANLKESPDQISHKDFSIVDFVF